MSPGSGGSVQGLAPPTDSGKRQFRGKGGASACAAQVEHTQQPLLSEAALETRDRRAGYQQRHGARACAAGTGRHGRRSGRSARRAPIQRRGNAQVRCRFWQAAASLIAKSSIASRASAHGSTEFEPRASVCGKCR